MKLLVSVLLIFGAILIANAGMTQEIVQRLPQESVVPSNSPPHGIAVEEAPQEILDVFVRAGIKPEVDEIHVYAGQYGGIVQPQSVGMDLFELYPEVKSVLDRAFEGLALLLSEADYCFLCFRGICAVCVDMDVGQ